jgi:hypothetical protein
MTTKNGAPKVRPGFNPTVGKPYAVSPLAGYEGCIVVGLGARDGEKVLIAELYVAAGQKDASYVRTTVGDLWLVDLPQGYLTSRETIRDAIRDDSGPQRPSGPPPW